MKIQLPDTPYKFVSENSQECEADTAFVLTTQNKKYLDNAKENKAHSIINIEDLAPNFGLNRIKIIGITGTNGKTTTAAAIYSILLDLGHKVAMQGTRGFYMDDEVVEGKTLTTPSVLNTYKHIYQAVVSGCEYFIMEVSSHAIVQKRIEGIPFYLKILTNITQDHLDYHNGLQEYIDVKNSFFDDDGLKLINKDETRAIFNFKNAHSYGIENPATYRIIAYTMNEGITAVMQNFQDVETFGTALYGFFNLYNMTAAVAAVHLLTEHTIPQIAEVTENFAGVSGRMEKVSEKPLVIVDFAHTPDGMQQILNSLREKELLVVFGAGGDRDKSKRPIMGRVASSFAKKIYITSDNPRHEDPDAIIKDIVEGIQEKHKIIINTNRREAIAQAINEQKGDEVILILGKGDETHQIIYDQKFPFDDREVVRELLANK
ncbi:MAG TPA: UDP-N-acetylmuramoyl-L-alanyl-D-glutamate--2,6-diaminopimelate ligase [Sulfurimonas sp.]|nr:UDP-N-acetylmuramoyl-L-alanyl-D-glutamate--2,6-diaminopimelate ligase [Sulfurimonas sp.]